MSHDVLQEVPQDGARDAAQLRTPPVPAPRVSHTGDISAVPRPQGEPSLQWREPANILEDRRQWNCDKCDHQASLESQLVHHIKIAHQVSCHTCKQSFDKFGEKMYHRKENHPSNKICRNSLNCEFVNTQKGYWYKHTTINTVGVLTPAIIASRENSFNCKICNNEFSSRNDLMHHRKRDHPGNVSQCKNYILGNCRRGYDDCWYHHGQLPTPAHRAVRQTIPNISSRQDFPEAPVLDQRN